MRHALPPRRTLRTGFTLVEMLVVMALIVLLAALAAGVANSGLIGSQRLSSGSNAVSGWLLIAKQTAARDGAPHGVRFFGKLAPDPNSPATATYLQFTSAQYIQQPDAVVFNPAQEGQPNGPCIVLNVEYDSANPSVLANQSRDIYFVVPDPAQAALLTDFDQRVAVDDTLVLPEYGVSSRITSISTPTDALLLGASNPDVAIPAGPTGRVRKLTIASAASPLTTTSSLDFAAAGQPRPASTPATGRLTTIKTYKFGFQNVPRPVLGEQPLTLSNDIGIDFRGPIAPAYVPATFPPINTVAPPPTLPYNPTTTIGVDVLPDGSGGYYFDIVFAPSGRVLGNTAPLTCLWVRDLSKIDGTTTPSAGSNPRAYPDAAGEQLLTVIYNRSGLIATQPVAPEPNPYLYATDGANNGI